MQHKLIPLYSLKMVMKKCGMNFFCISSSIYKTFDSIYSNHFRVISHPTNVLWINSTFEKIKGGQSETTNNIRNSTAITLFIRTKVELLVTMLY